MVVLQWAINVFLFSPGFKGYITGELTVQLVLILVFTHLVITATLLMTVKRSHSHSYSNVGISILRYLVKNSDIIWWCWPENDRKPPQQHTSLKKCIHLWRIRNLRYLNFNLSLKPSRKGIITPRLAVRGTPINDQGLVSTYCITGGLNLLI